jgi:GAF domain-containing protein
MIKIEDFAHLAQIHAAATKKEEIFSAVEEVIRSRVGFRLLTMLLLSPDGEVVQRIHTTNAHDYPLSGQERLGPTPWGKQVLHERRPFLGTDKAAVKWAFPADFELIMSLGIGSAMNVPIVALGRPLGSLNVFDAEGRYGPAHLCAACDVAPYLAVGFLFAQSER